MHADESFFLNFPRSFSIERKFVEGEITLPFTKSNSLHIFQDFTFHTRRSLSEKQITHQETNEQIETAYIHTYLRKNTTWRRK